MGRSHLILPSLELPSLLEWNDGSDENSQEELGEGEEDDEDVEDNDDEEHVDVSDGVAEEDEEYQVSSYGSDQGDYPYNLMEEEEEDYHFQSAGEVSD